MKNLRYFEEPGIGAMSYPVGGKREECLSVDCNGVIDVAGKIPTGFYLIVILPANGRVMVSQRDLGKHHGSYFASVISSLEDKGSGFEVSELNSPIPVKRAGKDVWLSWKGTPYSPSNKIDCWVVSNDGGVDLFQVGIVTHDNGKTFRLLGEYRWRGKLFSDPDGKTLGVPADPGWGAFGVRKEILATPNFQKLLPKLPRWKGRPADLDPQLDPVPGDGFARVQWYSPFSGQTGQGPVTLYGGFSSWVHGTDILDPPDADGVKRLRRNDLIAFKGIRNFGKGEATSLPCVNKVVSQELAKVS